MYLTPADLPRLTSHAIVNAGLLRQEPIEVRAEARRRMALKLLNEAVCLNVQEETGVNDTVFSVDFYLITPSQLVELMRSAMQDGAFDEVRRQRKLK